HALRTRSSLFLSSAAPHWHVVVSMPSVAEEEVEVQCTKVVALGLIFCAKERWRRRYTNWSALALAIACVRLCTPSLLQRLETCFFTVPRLPTRRRAISRLDAPVLSRCSTSRSRSVSGSASILRVGTAGAGAETCCSPKTASSVAT